MTPGSRGVGGRRISATQSSGVNLGLSQAKWGPAHGSLPGVSSLALTHLSRDGCWVVGGTQGGDVWMEVWVT